jgi:hypothetical protein
VNRVLTVAICLTAFGLFAWGLIQAERGVAHAYRWARFHLGRVKPDGEPLDKREAPALVSVRRAWRMPSAPEPAYQQQEDWQ